MNSANVPAGWYPNPADAATTRYWDGSRWTEQVRPAAWTAAPAPGMPTTPTTPTTVLPPAPTTMFPPAAPTSFPYERPGAPSASYSPPPPPAPLASAPAAPSKKPINKWLVGGAIAGGLIVAGSVGAALGGSGSAADEAAPTVTVTAPPAEVEEAPAEEAVEPAPEAPAEPADPVAFKAQSNSHLDDMQKDLDDIVLTVQEDGFWRLISNTGELSFNVGQLEALDVPATVGDTWPAALTQLNASLDVLTDAVSTQDGPTILAAVDGVRAQVEAARGVAQTAS